MITRTYFYISTIDMITIRHFIISLIHLDIQDNNQQCWCGVCWKHDKEVAFKYTTTCPICYPRDTV